MLMQSKDKNRGEASENLRIKLSILLHFVNKGIPWQRDDSGSFLREPDTGSRILDTFPKSAIQFSRWTLDTNNTNGLHNCKYVREELQVKFGKFTSHGQDSLTHKNRPAEYVQAKKLFQSLKDVAKHQIVVEYDYDLISELKAGVERWKSAAEAQATFVLQVLSEKGKWERETSGLKRAFDEYKCFAAETIAAKDETISLLTRHLREVRGFVSFDGDLP